MINSLHQNPTFISNPSHFLYIHPSKSHSHLGRVSSSESRIFTLKATIKNGFALSSAGADRSLYKLLGISESCGYDGIKQAYKNLARKYHPDVSPPERIRENTERFILVQQAYETLSDPTERARYDRDMILSSPRNKGSNREVFKKRDEWRNRFETQLEGLEEKSTDRVSDHNMSWAARMRRKRSEETD